MLVVPCSAFASCAAAARFKLLSGAACIRVRVGLVPPAWQCSGWHSEFSHRDDRGTGTRAAFLIIMTLGNRCLILPNKALSFAALVIWRAPARAPGVSGAAGRRRAYVPRARPSQRGQLY